MIKIGQSLQGFYIACFGVFGREILEAPTALKLPSLLLVIFRRERETGVVVNRRRFSLLNVPFAIQAVSTSLTFPCASHFPTHTIIRARQFLDFCSLLDFELFLRSLPELTTAAILSVSRLPTVLLSLLTTPSIERPCIPLLLQRSVPAFELSSFHWFGVDWPSKKHQNALPFMATSDTGNKKPL